MKQEFKNKEELVEYLRRVFTYKKASKEEIDNWPYDCKLYTSPQELIGKNLYHKNGEFMGVINNVEYGKSGRGNKGLIIFVGEKKYTPTDYSIELEDKIKNEKIIYPLHPTRKGKNFWENGYIVDEKTYKEMYYITEEYRNKFKNGMYEKYGVYANSTYCIDEIKNKIQKTMLHKYGVTSFLSRGPYYTAITQTMIEKFGVENLFYDPQWQLDNSIKQGIDGSKLEKNIISELINKIDFGKKIYYYDGEKNIQKSFKHDKKIYLTDFYSEDLNLIIEIFGDYWHANPEIYTHDFYNTKKDLFGYEIRKKDEDRKKYFIYDLKMKYFVIWENDWKKNKVLVIENIKKYINDIN